jgi:hypothetical protein
MSQDPIAETQKNYRCASIFLQFFALHFFRKARIAAADNPATELRRAQRAVMERKPGHDEIAMPVGKFGVVYCDAPWRFEPYDHDTGGARAADNHYPTMQLDRIKAMTIPARLTMRRCSCGRRHRCCHKR